MNSTRQSHWRVLQIVAQSLGIIVLGWIAFRITVIGIPLRDAPSDSDVAILIPRSLSAERLARGHFANVSAIPGGPWSISALLAESNRSIVIANSGDDTTVIIDRESQQLIDDATQFDLAGRFVDGKTVLSTSKDEQRLVPVFSRFDPGLFRPGTVALLHVGDTTTRVHYTPSKQRIVLASTKLLDAPTGGVGTPNENLIIAAQFGPEALDFWAESSIPLALPGMHAFAELSHDAGISAYVSLDAQGRTSYLFNWKTETVSNEDAAAIAIDLVAIPSIAIERANNPDASTRDELVTDDPVISARSEGEYIFTDISLGAEHVRLTLGPSTLSITNDFSVEALVAPLFSSSCASRSFAIVRPASIAKARQQISFKSSSLLEALWSITEIAQTDDAVRACWN